MSNLIVVGFKKDMYRASTVLNQLIGMDFDWVVDLRDAVAVYRDYSGRLRLDQSYRMTTAEGAGWGALWGSLAGMTLGALAIPFTGGTSAAVAGTLAAGTLTGGALGAAGGAIDADWWKNEFGISESMISDIGALVQPGDSAIFALIRTADPVYVAEQFRGYGGTVLYSTLTPVQEAKVQSVLANAW
jgi:uncharacterized membrane protein